MPAPIIKRQHEALEAIGACWQERGIAPRTRGKADSVNATAKELRHAGARLHLFPTNPPHKPLVMDPACVRLQGEVVSSRRDTESSNHEPGGSR